MSESKGRLYTVPDMEAAHRLGAIAQDALEAAREQAPDQHKHAGRLFRAIYGPLGALPVLSTNSAIKRTTDGAPK